jgi:hypothetical protein
MYYKYSNIVIVGSTITVPYGLVDDYHPLSSGRRLPSLIVGSTITIPYRRVDDYHPLSSGRRLPSLIVIATFSNSYRRVNDNLDEIRLDTVVYARSCI